MGERRTGRTTKAISKTYNTPGNKLYIFSSIYEADFFEMYSYKRSSHDQLKFGSVQQLLDGKFRGMNFDAVGLDHYVFESIIGDKRVDLLRAIESLRTKNIF